ncbi:MAG: DUF4105 domain-containing protein [Alphaproteobacteria bacterium]|nr:DUF4105 domain-containing protein [Alphaproteobacteria bacterium]
MALGHYHKGKSSIDSPNFFLAPDGKTNSQAELQATVDFLNGSDDKKKCMFPARYLYLKKRGLVTNPFPKCEEYEQFQQDLQPAGVTLLFTDAYMNNPSSMFGHTLFRIDTKRKGTQLLAHGVNYGAFTGDEPGALYAILGLTGGYYGGFTVKPYYDIINTYNNIENRDIWELNLDFTPEELNFFVAHLWEIGQTQSRYFFFSRNCSYMLMEMLDAVRPSLKLSEQFPFHAIPLDTFKAAYRADGLVKGINYRPSRQNKILHRYRSMNPKQKSTYLHFVNEKNFAGLEELNAAEQADVLETAYQFVQYQYVAKKLELGDYRKQSFDVLRARNGLKEKGSIEELKAGKSPLQAHESRRATIEVGVHNGEFFEGVSYRPAYQSLTDNDFGLPRGAEINFLETKIRHYDRQDNYVLENFNLLSIRSLSPISSMFQPFSFQIRTGIDRWQNPVSEREGYVGYLTVGTGETYGFSDNLYAFVLMNSKISYGGFLPHNSFGAIGINAGILASVGKWRLLAEIEPQAATQKLGNSIGYKAELNYIIETNLSLGTTIEHDVRYGKDAEEYLLGLRYYF